VAFLSHEWYLPVAAAIVKYLNHPVNTNPAELEISALTKLFLAEKNKKIISKALKTDHYAYPGHALRRRDRQLPQRGDPAVAESR
jgi:hypothetical protein